MDDGIKKENKKIDRRNKKQLTPYMPLSRLMLAFSKIH